LYSGREPDETAAASADSRAVGLMLESITIVAEV
jgi:hypothetical protein